MKGFQVVPFAPHIKRDGSSADAAKQLQQLIATMAQNGWEFYSIEHVTTYLNPGCLGTFLGHPPTPITAQFAIFWTEG